MGCRRCFDSEFAHSPPGRFGETEAPLEASELPGGRKEWGWQRETTGTWMISDDCGRVVPGATKPDAEGCTRGGGKGRWGGPCRRASAFNWLQLQKKNCGKQLSPAIGSTHRDADTLCSSTKAATCLRKPQRKFSLTCYGVEFVSPSCARFLVARPQNDCSSRNTLYRERSPEKPRQPLRLLRAPPPQ